MRFRSMFCTAALVAMVATGLGTTGVASAGPANGQKAAYTCTGGEIASGTYANIRVTGSCSVAADAVITVNGNISVLAGASLDAQSAPATITVGNSIRAYAGSLLGLGCQPANTIGMAAGVPCAVEPTGHTTITVGGNVTAAHANTVLIRQVTINGNVRLTGGGGEIPWSIKGNTIGGNLTISGVTADWLGVQFNQISRNATLTNITATDPGDPGRSVAVVENTVGLNLRCSGLAPAVSGGFIPGEVNHVGRKATGQCASLV